MVMGNSHNPLHGQLSLTVRIVTAIALALIALASPASAEETCQLDSGLCVVVDGDTFKLGQTTIRIENIDAPETHQAKCPSERRLGDRATARLTQILTDGPFELVRNPKERRDVDRYGRKLRRVQLFSGDDAGEVMVSEGLARKWTGKRRPWC